jgi:hypothetical protein
MPKSCGEKRPIKRPITEKNLVEFADGISIAELGDNKGDGFAQI